MHHLKKCELKIYVCYMSLHSVKWQGMFTNDLICNNGLTLVDCKVVDLLGTYISSFLIDLVWRRMEILFFTYFSFRWIFYSNNNKSMSFPLLYYEILRPISTIVKVFLSPFFITCFAWFSFNVWIKHSSTNYNNN